MVKERDLLKGGLKKKKKGGPLKTEAKRKKRPRSWDGEKEKKNTQPNQRGGAASQGPEKNARKRRSDAPSHI